MHSRGKVNKKYLEKAGPLARAREGDRLLVDDHYFEWVVGTIKDMYASMYRIVMRGYGDDERVAEVLRTKGIAGVVVL